MDTDDTKATDTSSQNLDGSGDKPSGAEGTQPSQKTQGTPLTLTEAELTYLGELHADKKHSKLDKQISTLATENADLKQRLGTIEAERETVATQQLQAKETAELEAAEGNSGLQTTIRQRYATTRKNQELIAENKRLDAETAEKKELLEALNKSDKGKLAEELAKEFLNVSADAILEFKADTPEELRAVAERLSKIAPVAAPKLPPPGSITPGVGGGLSEEAKLKREYPTMFPK